MTAQQQPSVLLVEDEPAQREVLAYNLEAEGFRVHQAGDGEEALMMVDETQPDIIILNSVLSAQPEVMQTIRFEKGLENVLFFIYQ